MASTPALLKSTENYIYDVLLSQNLRISNYNHIALKIYLGFPKNLQVLLIVSLFILLHVELLRVKDYNRG